MQSVWVGSHFSKGWHQGDTKTISGYWLNKTSIQYRGLDLDAKMNKIGMDLINFTLFMCFYPYFPYTWTQIFEWRQRDMIKSQSDNGLSTSVFWGKQQITFFISFDAPSNNITQRYFFFYILFLCFSLW